MTPNSQPPTDPAPNAAATAPGLPPVQPPSGRHILQMFVVPAIIVASIIGVALGVVWLFGGPRTPAQFLKKLDDPNPDVRWRTASDLAQVLLRDRDLAADADFALALAERLDRALNDSVAAEKALAERLAKLPDKDARDKEWQKVRGESDWRTLEAERNYIIYLGSCLGNFTVPVGVPLLKEMAEQTTGMEPQGLAERRWRAVFALANLGHKVNAEYPTLPDLRKDLTEAQLEKAVQNKTYSDWAARALECLKKRRAGKPDMMGLDATFEKLADPKNGDTFLRENVALALNFWTGTDAENEKMDRLLVALTNDPGDSDDRIAEMASQNPEGYTPSEVRALLVRYNANIALANRGSSLVRVPLLADMLDEDYLNGKLKSRRKDDSEITDANLVQNTLANTLRAVGTLHEKLPSLDLSSLKPAVDKLAGGANKAVKIEAEKVQKAL